MTPELVGQKYHPHYPWEPGDLCEESWLTFRGTKTSLIELAAFDHHLHGGGFSFNEEDVMDCFE